MVINYPKIRGNPKLEERAGQSQPQKGVARLSPNANVSERVEDGGVAENGLNFQL